MSPPIDAPSGPQRSRALPWLAVDVDGVLADHVSQIIPELAAKWGLRIHSDQVTNWDFPVGNTTFSAVLREQQSRPEFVLRTPPIEGAREGLRKLNDSFQIVIVTARPPEADKLTKEWLRMNGMQFSAYANLRTGGKHLTEMSCELLIDDYVGNLVGFLENTASKAIVFDQPWNRNQSELRTYLFTKRLLVARGWKEIPAAVARLSNWLIQE